MRNYGEEFWQKEKEFNKVALFSLHRDWMRNLPLKFAMLNAEKISDVSALPSWAQQVVEKI